MHDQDNGLGNRHGVESASRSVSTARTLLLGAALFAALVVVGYLTFVQGTATQSIDDAAYFGRNAVGQRVTRFDRNILDHITLGTVLLGAVVVLTVTIYRRAFRVGIIAVLGFGSAVVLADILKVVLPRPDLAHDEINFPESLKGNSYPSGHTTVSMSIALAIILIAAANWRPWLAIVAGIVEATLATGVVFAGWHRPSDALGGVALAGLCMSVAGAAAIATSGRRVTGHARTLQHMFFAAIAAAAIFGVALAVAVNDSSSGPDADAPFVLMIALVVTVAFSLTSWFAWAMRGWDWNDRGTPSG